MREPATAPESLQHANLSWDDQGQPHSCQFSDVYFSRANGLAETRHVFLHHNQLSERFSLLSKSAVFTVAETGFGSGLNFLACWQLWQTCAPDGAQLHFISTEKYPLTQADLTRALALWPELASFSQALIENYPKVVNHGFHRLVFAQDQVKLTLIIADAAAGLAQLLTNTHPHFLSGPKVDAWFLDGFAPAKNPQMWSQELFSNLGKLSQIGTTAATFSAAGIVKEGLRATGFTVKKVPGFGRKRDMVSAIFEPKTDPVITPDTDATFDFNPSLNSDITPNIVSATPRYSSHNTPWAVVAKPQPTTERTALIIGGGLAGCHSARALAERGWQVHMLERHPKLAQAASGNPQGALYAKLSPKSEAIAQFNLASLQFALRYYAPLWQQHPKLGQACGLLQLAHNQTEQKLQQDLRAQWITEQTLVQFVNASEASAIAGLPLPKGGLYFPDAGWLNPQYLCELLVTHTNIRVSYHNEALALSHSDGRWQVSIKNSQSSADQPLAEASVVVLANAADALNFQATNHLPLKKIRGQVSYLPESATSQLLRTVVCGDGYITPAADLNAISANDLNARNSAQKQHCLGATFNLKDNDTLVRSNDHRSNLTKVCTQIPALANNWSELIQDAAALEALSGRVAFRSATTDYLPVVGPAPMYEDFLQTYAPMRKDAHLWIPQAGSYWPNLYVNLGFGSRGLAYAPLCAELLVAQITGAVPPLGRDLIEALHPARFIIRNIQKNRC